ncbi:hypothetical protein PVAP13_5KG056487 [Panicum virgatum]|uniref:Uncharacterized protein n=1 Tax=Panicum virgatum TaxID=38727 RepID=A0A8T0SAF8_PANVG|nr:hypothetical protein PVAP13_5KG056487 [Panicum virgatum]
MEQMIRIGPFDGEKPQQDEHTSSSKKIRKITIVNLMHPGIQRKLMLGSPCQSKICVDDIKITIWFDLKSGEFSTQARPCQTSKSLMNHRSVSSKISSTPNEISCSVPDLELD